ncbi:staphylococcal nuclease domain-containing protein 1-like [Anneissia japonica]|uniref:staphylococcal nuclease domain-containing protein 1-like n=1 Tax=Anneissia japonica TaxID=1529436 RepID=UPI00142556BD|nr:staphylococcal nuclease domain-containing protein 1-like [Anneissia japonica]
MANQTSLKSGVVKSVLSGDAVIIRGVPKGGPPPEKQLCLSNVTAPKLARRANPNVKDSQETKDEPYAWQAREFLRKKLIGKEVYFTIEYTAPGSGRAYGCIYLGKGGNAENVTESCVAEGLVEVRRGGIKPSDDQTRLIDIEDAAKAAGKGLWAKEQSPDAVRDITWVIDNPLHFVDSHHQNPIKAIIEHVRDGCTVRAFLLPSFHYVTVMLSGIKAPMIKRIEDKDVPEPYSEEAKYFTESRLLQREVSIILEGTSNQNFLGAVLHPNGNIAEFLLKEGLARCVDWSMRVVTQGTEKLRASEKEAKEKHLRLWKDYVPNIATVVPIEEKNLTGKVVEVINADALLIKTNDSKYKKITLSSIRPPRMADVKEEDQPKDRRVRPLYDIPYMFEAREFLRKKLIGKKVSVSIDYIKEANDSYPEKTCGTVMIGNINIAEALVSKGFSTVLRHRQDDDQRSAHFDSLLIAESRAIKNSKGVHSKKDNPIHRVADVSGDAAKSRQFLPFLQRAGRSTGIVEFVASGSRIRLYLPKETCLITFLLAGITCPRRARTGPGGPGESELYAEEALQYTKELCLQREVEVEVENVDKAGNFIGWLFVEGQNHSVKLVENGLSKVHFTAERSNYYAQLQVAEEAAKKTKLKVWENFVEQPKVTVVEETERKTNYKPIIVTELGKELSFYAQHTDTGPQLEKLMEQLRAELINDLPLPGSYTPKQGDLCAAKYIDGEWYRGKVESVSKDKSSILFIDYGNRDKLANADLVALPPGYHTLPPQAHSYTLALVMLPKDEEARLEAVEGLKSRILDQQFKVNVEYRITGTEYVTLMTPDLRTDIGKELVSEGLVIVEPRREKRLQKLVEEYIKAQDAAKKSHLNLWRYGDITEDDAKEFGYQGY